MKQAIKTGYSPQNRPHTVVEKTRSAKPPSRYEVLMLNDDYTPMDFVVRLLQTLFKYDYESAVQIMLEVHHQKVARVGIYSREIAETKVFQANAYARSNEHPLLCIMQETELDA